MSSDDLKKIFDESIGSTKAYFVSKVQQKYPRLDKKDIEKRKKIYGSWEDAFGHFSSSQWKGGGIDGRVGPRTGASERRVLAHCAGARRGCVPSGKVGGTSPLLFPRDGKRAPDACS